MPHAQQRCNTCFVLTSQERPSRSRIRQNSSNVLKPVYFQVQINNLRPLQLVNLKVCVLKPMFWSLPWPKASADVFSSRVFKPV